MATPRQFREEATICRELMREIADPASIEMLRDRAEMLERRAAQLEAATPTTLVPLPRRARTH